MFVECAAVYRFHCLPSHLSMLQLNFGMPVTPATRRVHFAPVDCKAVIVNNRLVNPIWPEVWTPALLQYTQGGRFQGYSVTSTRPLPAMATREVSREGLLFPRWTCVVSQWMTQSALGDCIRILLLRTNTTVWNALWQLIDLYWKPLSRKSEV